MGSISIDLADAADEADMGKCDHFSIRGFVAETLQKDLRKCWPFSEESLRLVEKQGFTLPPLSVPKSKWWSCTSCVRDIDADEPKGTRSPKKFAVRSEVTPSQSKMNALAVVAGYAVEENENVNRERSQKDDHTTVEENANVNREKPQKDDHTTVEENANVNREKPQKDDHITVEENAKVNRGKPEKDDHTASTSLRRVRPPSMDANTVRNKSRKLEIRKPAGNKRSKEKVNKTSTDISRRKDKQTMDEAVSSEIAGVVEDTPPKATKNRKGDNVSSESINADMSVSTQPRKPRKSRPLSDFFGKTNTRGGRNTTRNEAPSSKRELVTAGRKRKMLPQVSRKLSTAGATSENASKSCGGSDQGDHSESTDSEFERDPIKGKQRNRRFQVVDEDVVPRETSQKGTRDNDADPCESALSVPCPPSKPRTKRKLSLAKRKRNKPVAEKAKSTGTDKGSLVKPRTGPSTNAISQPTQDLLNEVDDNRLASDGYVRKCNPQFNDKLAISLPLPDNDHGSSSKSNTGEGWLRTGLDIVDLNSNNNTEVADRSCVLQKDDASVADRKGKAIMVQEHHEAPISQIQDTDESTLEEQEIAEIMSNKLGVCLPNKEEVVINKQSSQETTTPKSKNPLLIDLNETYDHEVSLEEDNNNDNITSSQPKPVDSNARKEEEHFQIENIPRSVDFFALPQHHAPSPFGNFPPPPPTQDNRASSSYGPILLTGHNCQWLGNVQPMANHQSLYPSSFQAFRGFNPCQSPPHQYREAAAPLLVWPSSMIPPHDQHHSHRPLSFNMDQPMNLGMFSQASSSSQNPWNLNSVASNGMPKCGSYHPEFSFGCNHGAAGIHGGGSMDAFNHNSMPTLPLFTRMDPRLGFDIPADRHGSPKFTKRHFPPVNQPQQRMDFQRGDSIKKPYLGNRLETSRPVFQPSSSLSFQAKRNDTTPPAVFPTIKQDGRFQPLGQSNSMRLPLKSQVGEKEKKLKGKAKDFSDVDAAMRNSSGDIVCTVNKNPADFTVVEPGNVYMLTGEDMLPGEELLVPKRATYKRRRASLCKQTKKPAGPGTDNA